MEYRKYGDTFYIRMDRGDEIIEKILMVCKEEGIHSCTFNGIGGCGKALKGNMIRRQVQFFGLSHRGR